MTLHCEAKTKNINLFLPKDQLLSKVATDSYYTGEICNVLKCSPTLLNSLRSLQFCEKNELLHW